MKAKMTIDKAFRKAAIDPRIYGSFVEHIGRAVYGGIYEPGHPTADAEGFRGDVQQMVRELDVPLIRYPGGNFLSGYNWEDGVGPRESRPVRTDPAWRSLESNQVGTNEFMGWAQRLGVEPMMAVNLGSRGPEAARALLEYCNLPGGSYYSDLRRSHGVADPYHIKLWCLGNEMDGPWQICAKEPREYALIARETAKLMKMIDPSIELVACGSSNARMPTMGSWEQAVLEAAYPHIDYISMHIYIDNREDDTPLFLAKTLELEQFIHTIESVTDYVGGKLHSKKRIDISFDEWNVAYHSNNKDALATPWQFAPPLGEDVYNFQDALVCGLMLITLLRHADRIKVACQAQLINVIGAIMTRTGGPAWRQSIYYPYLHASRYGRGTLLDAVLESPGYDAGGFEGVPYLDAVAVENEEEGALTIFCVNRGEQEAIEFTARLGGYAGYRPVEHLVLASADKYAVNTEGHEAVAPTRAQGLTVEGETLRATLPPFSWNVLRLAAR